MISNFPLVFRLLAHDLGEGVEEEVVLAGGPDAEPEVAPGLDERPGPVTTEPGSRPW